MKIKNLLDDNENKPSEKPSATPLPIQVISPWTNIIIKTKIPDVIFQNLLELYEYTMKNKKSLHRTISYTEMQQKLQKLQDILKSLRTIKVIDYHKMKKLKKEFLS